MASEGRDSPEGSIWPLLEPRGLDLFKPSWEERGAWIDKALADCERWAALARTGIDTPSAGRPADDVARTLVRRLGEIWRTQSGQAPTLITDPYTLEKRSDFLNFCEQLIAPIWRGRGLTPPAVVAFVREYCYPPR
jgi:hypothetical protein